MLTPRALLIAAVPALLVGIAPLAPAQPATTADQLFDQGKRLMKEKKYAEACAAFEASQQMDPNPTTLFKLADCREQNGDLATAWSLYTAAAKQTQGDGKRTAVYKAAKKGAAALEPRLSMLTIAVPAEARVDGLVILRDEARVAADAWNKAVPVDGGGHVIAAQAPGHERWSTAVTVKPEGDRQTVTVPSLALQAAPPPVPEVKRDTEAKPAPREAEAKPVAPRAAPRVTRTARPEPGRSKALPLALGGLAVVALGAAVGAELWGEQIYDEAESEQDNDYQAELWADANTRRYAAEGLAVAGVGLATAAVWIYLRGGDERGPAVEVAAGPGATWGLTVGGAW